MHVNIVKDNASGTQTIQKHDHYKVNGWHWMYTQMWPVWVAYRIYYPVSCHYHVIRCVTVHSVSVSQSEIKPLYDPVLLVNEHNY